MHDDDATDDNATDDDAPRVDLAHAPLPTDQTIERRQSIPFQLFRFAAINLKMIRVIRRGHGETPSIRSS